jgi:L-cysteate sulfo-lyase
MNDSDPMFVPGPTPLEPAPRLAAALGLDEGDLLIKRDDLIGLGGGGNKVRKLQVTMGEALRSGASTVVTTGAAQSNHARLTAAAGARLGLRVVLVLGGDAPESARGNVLLDHLLGAEIIWVGDGSAEDHADALELESNATVHRIPFGGSSPASAEAYVAAGGELLAQLPDVRHVVVAVGSGGTMAGLVTAMGADRVIGVDCGAVPDARATVSSLLAAMRPETHPAAQALQLDRSQIGDGYEHVTPSTRDALSLAARTEGVLLDPTYTGRAMAGLVRAVADGSIRPGERTVFLHTGGLPGLFGHAEY